MKHIHFFLAIQSTHSIDCYRSGIIHSMPIPGNYLWQPGKFYTNQIVATPAATSVYSVSETNTNRWLMEDSYTLVVSECVGISQTHRYKQKFCVYQNPASDVCTAVSDNPIECNIGIFNAQGAEILSVASKGKVSNSLVIQLAGFPMECTFLK